MKTFTNMLALGLALGVASAGYSATPSYTTKSAAGNASAGAALLFPADPSRQIRLVSVQWQSDSNTAALHFQTALGAYKALATNTSSGVTQVVNTTAGLITNRLLMLQRAGVGYTALLVQTNNGTNAVLATGGWGVTPSIGDAVYALGETNSVPVGATTNWANGEALFVGQPGRPVRVQLTPALTTNRITTATARYE